MEYDIPEGSVVLNVLTIVEYMDPDGTVMKADFSHAGDDRDLGIGKAFELIGYAQAFTTSSMYVDLIHDHVWSEDDEEDEE